MIETRVNHELIDRIRNCIDHPIVDDDTYEIWRDPDAQERLHLTKLGEQCQAYTKSDFAAVVIVALENYPEVVLKAILDKLKEGSHDR